MESVVVVRDPSARVVGAPPDVCVAVASVTRAPPIGWELASRTTPDTLAPCGGGATGLSLEHAPKTPSATAAMRRPSQARCRGCCPGDGEFMVAIVPRVEAALRLCVQD